MSAQTNFASRFTLPEDPIEFLQMLQGKSGNGAPTEDLGPDTDAPDEAAEPSETEPSSEPKSGRKANGQFAKGNLGGPGNPFNRQVAALRKQLIDAMTPAVFQRAIQALMVRAFSGDMAALKLLFQYTLGKPAEAKDPDRVA